MYLFHCLFLKKKKNNISGTTCLACRHTIHHTQCAGPGRVHMQLLDQYYPPACMLSHFSHAQLFATPRTVACKAPLSMGFSRQEYWSGLPCPPIGDLPDPAMEPTSPVAAALQMNSLSPSHWGRPKLETTI